MYWDALCLREREQKNDILLVENQKKKKERDICNPRYHQQDEKVYQGARMTCLTRWRAYSTSFKASRHNTEKSSFQLHSYMHTEETLHPDTDTATILKGNSGFSQTFHSIITINSERGCEELAE